MDNARAARSLCPNLPGGARLARIRGRGPGHWQFALAIFRFIVYQTVRADGY